MLAVRRVRLLFKSGRQPHREATAVLAGTRNAEHAAEMRWILAWLDYHRGEAGKAFRDLDKAALDPAVPDFWKARYEAAQSRFVRTKIDTLDSARLIAHTALEHAVSADDPTAAAHALRELWYMETVHRDHAAALAYVDRGLSLVAGNVDLTRVQLGLLDNKVFSLQNLDLLDEASETLAWARALASHSTPPAGRPHVAAAVHYYWLGRWDDALAELEAIAEGRPEGEFDDLRLQAPLLQHGVAALIAVHRGDTNELQEHLRAANRYPLVKIGDQENSDFLVVAKAFAAERDAGINAALDALEPLLDPNYGRTTLRHQWSPHILRLALEAGDVDQAHAVLEVCRAEAALEVTPARAASALNWCEGLIDGDPEPLMTTARHYREVGRRVEVAMILQDAAVMLAKSGDLGRARQAGRDALVILAELGAAYDVSRVEARLRPYGIRRASLVVDQPAVAGWHSLTDTDRLIAERVAAGRTNLEIAAEFAMSRSTVGVHVSLIMRTIGASSRPEAVEKISEALSLPRTRRA